MATVERASQSIMIGFNLLRHGAGAWMAAAVAGAALSAAAPAAAQDAANPNVIVDESVLDGLAGAPAADAGLLRPPADPPVSRLVTSSAAAVGLASPPEATDDTTFSAAPTTPIQSAPLDESVSPDDAEVATATVPAAGDDGDAATAAAEEQSVDEQTAARPPLDGMVRVPFAAESAAIPEPAMPELDALAERLNADYLLRVQVLAYAAGDEDQSTHARGVSLARALAMREYLAAQGVAMDRMDIRALGNSAQEEPADRVDLIPLAQ
jgi:outer membrane protein OmpA-like peptidoglycan-associated protein